MSARHLIDDLHRLGLRIKRDGERLTIEGPEDALTPDLIERVRREKPAILALLASAPGWHAIDGGRRACNAPWTDEDWREHFAERVAVAMIDGEQPEAEARRNAYECCIVRWLDLHPVKSDGAACVACGKPDRPGDSLNPFGVGPHAWLHSRCWPAWHDGRRAEATAALANAGITLITEHAA